MRSARSGQVQDGIYYLLRDTQVRVVPGGDEVFSRIAYRVTDRAGLEEGAGLQEAFDPANSTLAFHYVHIIRDGKPIDALVPKDILVLRRERRMERGVFDGTLNGAHLELRDLRVGDIVDYAVTWQAAHPAMAERLFQRA